MSNHYAGSPTHVMRPNGAFYRFTTKSGRVERCKPDEARLGVVVQVGCRARILPTCKSRTRGQVGIVDVIGFHDFEDSTKFPQPNPIIEIGVEFGNSHEAIWYNHHEIEVMDIA